MSSTKLYTTTGCNKDSKVQCCSKEKCICNCVKVENGCSGKKCCQEKCSCNCVDGKNCGSDEKCCETKCNCQRTNGNCYSEKPCCETATSEPDTKETEEYPNACKCQGCVCLCMLPQKSLQIE